VVDAITVFPVTMRSAPTALEQTGTATDYSVRVNGNTTCSAVPTLNAQSDYNVSTLLTVASGLTAGQCAYARANSTTAYLAWSAEL
jgi:hypothetical protein